MGPRPAAVQRVALLLVAGLVGSLKKSPRKSRARGGAGPMVVISVSLSGKELHDFDELVKHFGYGSRSRAVRDALYHFISQHRMKFNKGDVSLVLTLVYAADHGSDDLNEVIHSHQGLIRTSLHNHLGAQCVDVLVTRGGAEELHNLLDELARVKEVRVSVTALAS